MDLEPQEAQNRGVELRVLHGPQAGSRLPLMPGAPYLIGAGDACDIMLAGAQVEDEHAQLEVDESHWSIAAQDGRALRLDGTPCEADQPLAFGDVVQLGRVKISVDLQGADWPEDEALEPRPRPEPEHTAETSDSEPPPADEDAGPTPPAPAPAPVRRWRWGRRAVALLGFSAVAGSALALIAYAAWQASLPPEEAPVAVAPPPPVMPPAPAPEPTPAQRMQEWLQRQQASVAPRLVLEGDGQAPWRVTGNVRREEDRQRLQDATRELPWSVEIAVHTLDERITALRRHLAQLPWSEDLSLRLNDASRDNPRVRVIAASQGRADTAIAQLHQALRSVEPIETEVLLPAALRQRFMAQLDSAGLAKRFETVRTEPDLALRALLTQNEVAQWEKLFADFTAEYGSVLRIGAVIRTERDAIESKIRVVVSGPYPYVVTTSGQRVAPGGNLDGRTVLTVNAQEVVFADGLRVRLRP